MPNESLQRTEAQKRSLIPGHSRASIRRLYRDLLGLLNNYDVSIISSVHNLNECHGIKIYKWDLNRGILWATKEQFKFIAERFEKPFLKTSDDYGIIIADKYSEHKGEIELLKEISFAITFGTNYRKFKRICMNPLMAISDFCPPIQISDAIIGIIVGALAQSQYAQEYIKDLAFLFLKDPHDGSLSFFSTISSSILGYGLILFPPSFRAKGIEMLKKLDTKYVYTNEGIKEKRWTKYSLFMKLAFIGQANLRIPVAPFLRAVNYFKAFSCFLKLLPNVFFPSLRKHFIPALKRGLFLNILIPISIWNILEIFFTFDFKQAFTGHVNICSQYRGDHNPLQSAA